MAIKVQIRRGTKAQLTTYGALSAGELGYTTDEKLVYVGDGTTASNFLVGRCASGSGAPSGNLIPGTVYFDTAADRFYFCNGSSWEAAAINPLAINDAGTGNTDLWSAQKIQSAIDAAVFGIGEFLESVLDRASSPPGSPTSGDRYIIVATATGAWVGKENQVAEYVTNAWQYTSATEGMCAYVDDEDLLYIFNGTSWVPINNYALASTEPGAVASSTSGQIGTGTTLARADHNHDLGTHAHSDNTNGGTIAHTALTSIGTNTHAQIDTFISSKASASGLASLDGSSLVVQNPANATATPTASKIPIANSGGQLASGWGGAASTLATLDANTLVVQNPANATATPTASKIPIADSSGKLAAGWGGNASTLATLNSSIKVVQDPANATSTPTASKIVMAAGDGKISDGWLPTLDGGTFGA